MLWKSSVHTNRALNRYSESATENDVYYYFLLRTYAQVQTLFCLWDKSLVEEQVVEFKPHRIGWIRFLQRSVFAGETARGGGEQCEKQSV